MLGLQAQGHLKAGTLGGRSLACFAGVEASGAFRGWWVLSGKLGFGDGMGQGLHVYLRSSLSRRRDGVF